VLKDGWQLLICHQERRVTVTGRTTLAEGAPHGVPLQDPVAGGFAVASLWVGDLQVLVPPGRAKKLEGGRTRLRDLPPREAALRTGGSRCS
jgi:hypothetical protein